MRSTFKEVDVCKRKQIHERQKAAHPDKMGIIVQLHHTLILEGYHNFKLMINPKMKVVALKELIVEEIKRMHAKDQKYFTKSFVIFCGNKILKTNIELGSLIEKREKDDGFLYLLIGQQQSY